MHSRDSDSGQLNRYSLGIAEADPFVVVLAFFFFRVVGNVFTSNDDDAPSLRGFRFSDSAGSCEGPRRTQARTCSASTPLKRPADFQIYEEEIQILNIL